MQQISCWHVCRTHDDFHRHVLLPIVFFGTTCTPKLNTVAAVHPLPCTHSVIVMNGLHAIAALKKPICDSCCLASVLVLCTGFWVLFLQ